MAPWVCLTWAVTPEVPWADWPPLACQALPPVYGKSLPAAAIRYLVKLSVVPESSERWNAWIDVDGREALGFSFLIAWSFHFVILLLKILARVGASRTRLFTPGRLYMTAIGPPTMGMSMAWPPEQTDLDFVTWSGF